MRTGNYDLTPSLGADGSPGRVSALTESKRAVGLSLVPTKDGSLVKEPETDACGAEFVNGVLTQTLKAG